MAVPAAQPRPGLEQTVQYLLDYVRGSDLTFIRNSKVHDGPEAAEHMNKKYQHFKDDIETAEDFIDRAASKSLLTGKPYTVVMENGTSIPTRDWLTSVLADYRKQYLRAPATGRPETQELNTRQQDE